MKAGGAAWLWCACLELGNVGSNSSCKEWLCVARWSLDTAVRSRISVLRTLLLCLGYLSAFSAIVAQVSLVETAVDKVTSSAVLGTPHRDTALEDMGITASTLLPRGWSDARANQGPDPSQSHRVSSHRGQSFLLPQCNPAGPCRLRCSIYFAGESLPWDIWHRNWLLSARQFSFIHPCSFYPYC